MDISESTTALKICTKCKEPFPATPEYFARHSLHKDGLYSSCKSCKSKAESKYRAENKEKLSRKSKEIRERDKEKIRVKKREYYLRNRDIFLQKSKSYRETKREEIQERDRKYRDKQKRDNPVLYKSKLRVYYIRSRDKNRDRARARGREYSRAWRANNNQRFLEKQRLRRERLRQEHPEKLRMYNQRVIQRRRESIFAKINHRISSAMLQALKYGKGKNGSRWETLVGYTCEELKHHLESQFSDGMTWDAFMAGAIHIDHKKPVSAFTFTDTDDLAFKECWALANLQPLWRLDNLRKSNRIGSIYG